MFSGTKIFLLLTCSLVVATASANVDLIPLGGENLRQSERVLQDALTKVAAGEGPNYAISKLHSATGYTDGQLAVNVDLLDKNLDLIVKNCKVTILSGLSYTDNGVLEVHHSIAVTFECEGREKVVRNHTGTYKFPYKLYPHIRYG